MWDTLINFWNIGIHGSLIFGDNCRFFFKYMGYFLKKLMGYGILGPPFQGLSRLVNQGRGFDPGLLQSLDGTLNRGPVSL